MSSSANGWPVYTSSNGLADFLWVTGRVRPGDVFTIFDHLCRRFHAEVEPIIRPHSWGYAYRAVRGQTSGFSNHASGTALDLNAPAHGLGLRYTFTANQAAAIRRILADLDGAVRWGGDYTGRPDEMHFEINTDAAALSAVVARITANPEDIMNPAQEKKLDDLANEVKALGKQNATILKRLEPDAAIRARLAELVKQGRADARDLTDLADMVEKQAKGRA